jgi:hypothetical protein
MTKIAFVVQRYGDKIVGGAESYTRELAETLVKKLGWQVDVLTTCAHDYMTWKNEYPEQSFTLNGVKVKRFASLLGRSPLFSLYHRYSIPVIRRLRKFKSLNPLVYLLEWIWLLM